MRVAKLLAWLLPQLDKPVPHHVADAAEEYYGSLAMLDQHVALLCEACKTAPEELIYNGRDRMARDLADWWEEHQEADAIREQREAEEARVAKLRKQAMSKLTTAERDTLGIEEGATP